MHMSNPRFLFLLLMALFSLVGNPGTSRADAPGEYLVKAELLYHFVNFVDWPSSAFKATDGRLRFCIIGKGPFGQTLEDTLAKKTIRERPFEIHRNPPKTELQHCHVLYLPASASQKLQALRHRMAKEDVLTVGETLDFMKQGGMVQFFVDNQKIRFSVNPNAVNETNLKVSSKLLRLAKIYNP